MCWGTDSGDHIVNISTVVETEVRNKYKNAILLEMNVAPH